MPTLLTHTHREPAIRRGSTIGLFLGLLLSFNAFAESGIFDAIRADVVTDMESITGHSRRARGMYLALSNALQSIDFRTNQTDEAVLMRVTQSLPTATFEKYSPLFDSAGIELASTLSAAVAVSADTVNSLEDSKVTRRAKKQLVKLNKRMVQLDEASDPWKRALRLEQARRAYDKLGLILSDIL
jgi:hypothetical protein